MRAPGPAFDQAAFDYRLPDSAIAQEPAARREAARLLVIDRAAGTFRPLVFADILSFCGERDLLVLNDTRVIPARLRLRKPTGGRVEALALRLPGGHTLEALVRGRITAGVPLAVDSPAAGGETVVPDRRSPAGTWTLTCPARPALETLARFGEVPLPPYIRRRPRAADGDDYQTVYGRRAGAVAAPTAGLHFTRELLASLVRRGTQTAFITLHVGWGTFRTVRAADIRDHRMDEESFAIDPPTAGLLNDSLAAGRRLTAVGTTVVRTLEGARGDGGFAPGAGRVGLYIYPGYRFRTVDRMITNFHLPRTTTLFMTAAFCGRELLLEAYRFALAEGFRFGSYGDAMLIT